MNAYTYLLQRLVMLPILNKKGVNLYSPPHDQVIHNKVTSSCADRQVSLTISTDDVGYPNFGNGGDRRGLE